MNPPQFHGWGGRCIFCSGFAPMLGARGGKDMVPPSLQFAVYCTRQMCVAIVTDS
jgi:hypothetical protein